MLLLLLLTTTMQELFEGAASHPLPPLRWY